MARVGAIIGEPVKTRPHADTARVDHYVATAHEDCLPGHATIADSGGTVVAQLSDADGAMTATVTLDPTRNRSAPPPTFGQFVYPAGLRGACS